MRKSSKMLSLVIALIFLFSAVTPALALSADAPDAGARLKALGVIAGYPDGSLGLDRNITRAEMTVVLSEMYGMGQASEILKNVPSKFSDIATGAWYTGYVNLAQQQGWVSGYPDGSFKPNANVSYAEAITMIVNLLGYGKGELPGTWPLNYVVKATDIGITSGVTYSANSPAPRGDVFVMASKALDKEMVTWSKDESKFEPGALLITRLDLEELKDVIIEDAFVLLGHSEADREDRIVEGYRKTSATTTAVLSGYSVAEGFDIRPYVGIETDFYVNDDKEIVAVASTTSVREADLADISVTSGVYSLVLDDSSDTTYTISPNGVFIVNEQVVDIDELPSVTNDGSVRFVVSSREVVFLEVVDYGDMTGVVLVDEVDVDDDLVDITSKTSGEINLDSDDDYIVVVGDATAWDEIKENDVVYYVEGSDEYALFVVRNTVSGAADRYVGGDRIRIAGTNYDTASTWYASTDGGKNYDTGSSLESFSGESAIAYLNGYGDIYAISGDVDAAADNVAVIDGAIKVQKTGISSWKYTVDLFLANGTVGTYEFKDGTISLKEDGTIRGTVYSVADAATDLTDAFGEVTTVGTTSVNKTVVKYNLNSAGKIDAFNVLSGEGYATIDLDDDDMADYSRVDSYYRTSSTVFFQVNGTDSDDWKVLSWDDVKVSSGSYLANVYLNSTNADDLDYLVFNASIASSASDYAVVLSQYTIGSGSDAKTYVEVMTVDGTVEYEYEASDLGGVTPVKKDIIRIDSLASGKITDGEVFASTPAAFDDQGTLASSPYDSSRNRIKVSGRDSLTATDASPVIWADVDSDTLIVDYSGTSAAKISASSLRRDWTVRYVVEYGDPENYADTTDDMSAIGQTLKIKAIIVTAK